MNYEELKADYIKNLKIGIGLSFILHIIALCLLLLFKTDEKPDTVNGYKSNGNVVDLSIDNIYSRPPGISEEKPGGGGQTNRISGTPVPAKEITKVIEFDQSAPAKGDSTKRGSGGTGTGTGIGTGRPPVELFKKSDYLIAVEIQPEPIGGYAAIDRKAVLPEAARKNSISGKVFLQVYINENGEVVFAEVLKGLGYGCDEAALKAIKLIRFKAGKQKGRYVKVQMSVPVNFIQ